MINSKINARPTKEFFITMLIKDIGLIRAIIDLIDNSVDGALRVRENGNYDGLWINILISKEKFSISDNCGGISIEIAKEYAFRFGRPANYKLLPKSVGQFGVGMKRTFFKLGNKFHVESRTSTEKFVIDENVKDWKKKEEWEFEFQEVIDNLSAIPIEECGTLIDVTDLHPSVADDFSLESFKSSLSKEIERAHLDSLQKGLSISVNNVPLKYEELTLLSSGDILTGFREIIVNHQQTSPVNVKIFSGISTPNPSDAGWYIFCNGRMVLEADKTESTGWNGRSGKKTPQYHNDFARFRGFSFFESNNASLLPWNTTKTGVDNDSLMYRSIRLEMIDLMRPVLEFLRKVSDEKRTDDVGPYQTMINSATSKRLMDITNVGNTFSFTKPEIQQKQETGRIQYSRPLSEIKLVQKKLNINTMKEVGEKTFEYFLKMNEE